MTKSLDPNSNIFEVSLHHENIFVQNTEMLFDYSKILDAPTS